MTLEEILQIEAQNVDCIFLYQEEGAWYAYEHSAFYCYSLLGILDIDWLPCPDGVSSGQKTIRVRVSEPDKFLCTPLLRLMRKRKQNMLFCVRFRVEVFIIGGNSNK